jgi:hypothetical protein
MITKLWQEKLITELTRFDILQGISPDFVHHSDYYKDLKSKITSQPTLYSKDWFLDAIDKYKFTFKIKSATTTNKFYNNEINFIDAYNWLVNNFDIKQYDIKTDTGIKKVMYYLKSYFRGAVDTDDIYVFCDCDAFRYYYNYLAYQIGITKNVENRPAPIRNSKDRGDVCKHLNFSLKAISDNKNKARVTELLVNEFLDKEVHQKLDIPIFWRGYFDFLKMRVD